MVPEVLNKLQQFSLVTNFMHTFAVWEISIKNYHQLNIKRNSNGSYKTEMARISLKTEPCDTPDFPVKLHRQRQPRPTEWSKLGSAPIRGNKKNYKHQEQLNINPERV